MSTVLKNQRQTHHLQVQTCLVPTEILLFENNRMLGYTMRAIVINPLETNIKNNGWLVVLVFNATLVGCIGV